ncbi:carbohydrate-binding domain-containing protein [Cavenderia fasciculata]|uniref:Carbohydrate-binding domain-containing protein n=1 Tax=Cavenderia fasciculata TaxID=261658 RepID=F4PGJ2_CACFS|nr:carbohydrate-binding domain-containing protein [Cavenderia fasciculata]EGG24826.1 carbohydrate-binding domain-containing protein [Cavenderia fasciculata]|eukprot:XP_004362677.1 carbohydrate-binding domain-containing protein [Cavenderia fasciculata]
MYLLVLVVSFTNQENLTNPVDTLPTTRTTPPQDRKNNNNNQNQMYNNTYAYGDPRQQQQQQQNQQQPGGYPQAVPNNYYSYHQSYTGPPPTTTTGYYSPPKSVATHSGSQQYYSNHGQHQQAPPPVPPRPTQPYQSSSSNPSAQQQQQPNQHPYQSYGYVAQQTTSPTQSRYNTNPQQYQQTSPSNSQQHVHYHQHHHYSPDMGSSNASLKKSPPPRGDTIPPIPGAYGDGVHDDTIAVSRYIQNYPSSQVPIPPGNYLITSSIRITKSNIQIIGSNDVKFIGNFASWVNDPPMGTHFIHDVDYIFVLTGDNILINKLNLYNFCQNSKSAAAVLLFGNGFVMMNCLLDNFNQGLVFGRMNIGDGRTKDISFSNIKVTSNQITNIIGFPGGSISYGDGICFFGCKDVVIANNYVSAKPGCTPRNGINSGPEGYVTSTNVKYDNNTLRGDWDYPLTTEGGSNCILSNNDIQGSNKAGIIERGTNIQVINNKVTIQARTPGEDCAAINLYGVDQCYISGNTLGGEARYGIIAMISHETAGGNQTVIENNTIEGNFFSCVYFGQGVNDVTVRGNVILGNSTNNDSAGVQCWYATGVKVMSNNINIPNGTATLSQGASDIQILNNTMMTSRAGCYVCRESKCVSVEGNDFLGITQSKFGESNDCQDVVCKNNHGIDTHHQHQPPQQHQHQM